MNGSAADPQPFSVRHTPGILTIVDANTTIGYCRDDVYGGIEYIFVHPAHRRRGHARRMLDAVRARVHGPLRLGAPVSPLGRFLLRYCGASGDAPSAAVGESL